MALLGEYEYLNDIKYYSSELKVLVYYKNYILCSLALTIMLQIQIHHDQTTLHVHTPISMFKILLREKLSHDLLS